MIYERAGPRTVLCLLTALVLALLCQAVASANPDPADWNTTYEYPYSVSPSQSGGEWTFTVTLNGVAGLTYGMRAFGVDPTPDWTGATYVSGPTGWTFSYLSHVGGLEWLGHGTAEDVVVASGETKVVQFKANGPTTGAYTFNCVAHMIPYGYETFWAKPGTYKPPSPMVPVPEPGTLALLATGGLGMLPLLKRRRTA
ncbi:MAG: PEP-CTERM sorting domain-containing protein [Armatimonadota bacterium]